MKKLFSIHSMRRAFSLAELLVAIGILTVLIGLSVPAVLQVQQSMNKMKAITQGKRLYEAANKLIMDMGTDDPNAKLPSDIFWWQKQLERFGIKKRDWFIPGVGPVNYDKDKPHWLYAGVSPWAMAHAEDKSEYYLFVSTEMVMGGVVVVKADGTVSIEIIAEE
jgi:type II secretory pathway pseudopilin PulG